MFTFHLCFVDFYSIFRIMFIWTIANELLCLIFQFMTNCVRMIMINEWSYYLMNSSFVNPIRLALVLTLINSLLAFLFQNHPDNRQQRFLQNRQFIALTNLPLQKYCSTVASMSNSCPITQTINKWMGLLFGLS